MEERLESTARVFSDIEAEDLSTFLREVREDLITGRYKPMPNRRVEIPKGNGKVRTLQIPTVIS
jgi:RNA-directed DNA polymerase